MTDALDATLKKLERLNQFWTRQHTTMASEPPADAPLQYAIPIAAVGDWTTRAQAIKRLSVQPFLYRLNYIRQLSTTFLAVSLEAAHNRLAHSLGTVDLAAAFLDSIAHKGHATEQTKGDAILLLALLHDAFHGPLGHTLDLVRDVFWHCAAGRVDKALLRDNIADAARLRKGPLWKLVLDHLYAGAATQTSQVFEHLHAFVDDNTTHPDFGMDIVDGPVDADRLDYLWRDSHHLLVSTPWQDRDTDTIIASATVLKTPTAERLFFQRGRATEVIRRFLEERKRFYTEYYEHPKKTVLDEMLTHSLVYATRSLEIFDNEKYCRQFAAQLNLLVDHDLIHFLTDMCSQPGNAIARCLLHDVLLNRPFEIVWEDAIPVNELRELAWRSNELRMHTPLTALPVEGRLADVLRRRINCEPEDGPKQEISPPTKERLFWLQKLWGGAFKRRFLLEIALWAELQAQGLDDILIGLAEELTPKVGQEQDPEAIKETFRQLQITPLVFVSLSWIPSLEYYDLIAHGRGYRPSDIRFCADARPTDEHLELRFHDDEVDYPAMVSIPAYIAKHENIKDRANACFTRLVNDAAWADRDFPFNWCSDKDRLSAILDAWADLKLTT